MLQGAFVGLLWIIFVAPFLLALTIANTALECLARLLRPACPAHALPLAPPAAPAGPVLVYPGTCTWVFHQMGMTLYLVEHYKTEGLRVVGVSSGAVCAAVMCGLEQAAAGAASPAAAATAVLRKGDELWEAFEVLAAPQLCHPTSWFGRLGPVLGAFLRAALPESCAPAGDRVTVGFRRLSMWPVPHLQPAAASGWRSKAEFIDGVLAACNVFPVVSSSPVRRFRNDWCSDGVNPFSLWGSLGEYALQLLSGRAATTCPAQLFGGRLLEWIYAAWNAAAMDVLLPQQSATRAPAGTDNPKPSSSIWITPGGDGEHLHMRYLLDLSLPRARLLWKTGYRHARELDVAGHFRALTPRPSHTETATSAGEQGGRS